MMDVVSQATLAAGPAPMPAAVANPQPRNRAIEGTAEATLSGEGNTEKFSPSRAVVENLRTSVETFKKLLKMFGDPAVAGALTGFSVAVSAGMGRSLDTYG